MLKKLTHKAAFLMFSCLIICNYVDAQRQSIDLPAKNEKEEIYSGGMLFLQGGGLIYDNPHQQIKDISYGFGGILRVYFFKHLCVGIYGGTQKTSYPTQGSNYSYLQIGYGGPFIGMSLKKNNFRYSASACLGGGSIKNLHIEKQNNQLLSESYLYKIPVFILSPLVSVDYFLSKKIALSLQGSCLFGLHASHPPLYNPCLQVGILFNH
jgi:hypothetical protein